MARGLTRQKLLHEKEWRRCRGQSEQDVDALMYWAEKYAYIQHPELGSILIPLRPAQKEILDTWLTERYSIVLKARQIGWSTLVALYALWLAFFWPDRLIMMLSKGEREAEKLLLKSTYAYDRLPKWMKDRGPKRLTKNLKKLSFSNASTIESLPSKEDPGRSATASLVIVDEWAFLENAEAAWASIEPIADVGGRVIGLSTANGSGDFFHTFWNRAVSKESGFKHMFYSWRANAERDDAWYATKRRTMLEWQLHQEYPNTPEEAFIKSGRPVFDVDYLRGLKLREPIHGNLDHLVTSVRGAQWVLGGENAMISIWDMPTKFEAYVLGVDVSEGLDYGDYSSIHVLSIKDPHVVATLHAHIDPDLLGVEAAKLGYFYGTGLVGVEVNNHGLTTCKALQHLNYPRIYFRRDLDKHGRPMRTQVGWYTSVATKPILIDHLVRDLRWDEALGRPAIVCEDEATIGELITYVRDEKGGMGGSPFDDRVISLALANQMRPYATAPDFVQEEDDYWTFNYHMRRVTNPEGEYIPLGIHNRRKAG